MEQPPPYEVHHFVPNPPIGEQIDPDRAFLYRLPPDTIIQILRFAVIHTPAIRLAHITSPLRQFALATPALWSTIRFTDTGLVGRRNFDGINFHLARSTGMPLNLSLFFGDYSDSIVVARLVFRLIHPHIYRVRDLQIRDENLYYELVYDHQHPISQLCALWVLKAPAPTLQSLDLYSVFGDLIPSTFLAGTFPNLRRVTAGGSVHRISSAWFLALPPQLEELHFKFVDQSDLDSNLDRGQISPLMRKFDPILRLYATSLVKLTLAAVELYDSAGDWNHAPLVFDRLEVLTIQGCITFMLNRIVAPRLVDFEIDSNLGGQNGNPSDYPAMVVNIMDFLKHHASTLESIDITLYSITYDKTLAAPFSADNLGELLRQPATFPLLRKLSAHVGVGLAAIAIDMVMPHLVELTLVIVEETVIPWTALGHILLGSSTSLQRLSIIWDGTTKSQSMVGDLEDLPEIRLPSLQELRLRRVPEVHILTHHLADTLSVRKMILASGEEVCILTIYAAADTACSHGNCSRIIPLLNFGQRTFQLSKNYLSNSPPTFFMICTRQTFNVRLCYMIPARFYRNF